MTTHEELIASLQAQITPISPHDPMAEAGRKALLDDLVKMLHHEAGSRIGEDVEAVHDMRVSIRRMRSTLRLLAEYYKPKAIQPYLDEMRKIARALGAVRDLDVMIDALTVFQANADRSVDVQPAIDRLDLDRTSARADLIRLFDKGSYARFVEDFAAFVTKPGKGALPVDPDDIHPYQVRHLLPGLIYAHLAAARAYDDVLAANAVDANLDMLHALRIEFKRLRYAVSIFSDVLGGSASEFIDELKAIQDHLGGINDARAAKDRLNEIATDLDVTTLDALYTYVQALDDNQLRLREGFGEVWKHFNTKTVQRQLANAIASL